MNRPEVKAALAAAVAILAFWSGHEVLGTIAGITFLIVVL